MLTDAINISQMHQEKGKKAFALTTLSSSLSRAISHAVCNAPTADSGLTLLHELGITKALHEFTALNRWALGKLDAGPVESAVVNEPTLLCLAWFCADRECAAMMLDVLRSPKVQRHFPLTGFWREFSTGLVCLADRQLYDISPFKPKGYQRYLMPYLSLISDRTYGRDTRATLAEVDLAFQTRNRDKRCTDWHTIDGDGNRPVRWDFRRETLLQYKPA
jgi:hypothetical protein